MASEGKKFCSGMDGIMIDQDHSYFRELAEKKKGGK